MSMSLKAIPLCQLQRSKINVRKTDKTSDIEQLAASIEAHGLLENLIVSPLGTTTGADAVYDVIAGGRRYAALRLLAKRKKIETDFPVSCQVRKPNGGNLTELSLAENVARAPLHPADQFEAFAKLQSQGLSADDIGARFGLSTTLVTQRLKLAAVSPKLLAEYRKDAMTLEQLMAFTLTDDHKAQEEVWFENGYPGMPASDIRRALTKSQIEGRDRRALFVGTEAYEAAGGVIVRDLFDEEPDSLWDWLAALGRPERESLLAHCVAMTIDAVWRRDNGNARMEEADLLAKSVSLDMTQWWRPSCANFLGSISKDQIVQAVTEAVSAQDAKRLAILKKSQMVERAETLLAPTRWLPQPLRTSTASPSAADEST